MPKNITICYKNLLLTEIAYFQKLKFLSNSCGNMEAFTLMVVIVLLEAFLESRKVKNLHKNNIPLYRVGSLPVFLLPPFTWRCARIVKRILKSNHLIESEHQSWHVEHYKYKHLVHSKSLLSSMMYLCSIGSFCCMFIQALYYVYPLSIFFDQIV